MFKPFFVFTMVVLLFWTSPALARSVLICDGHGQAWLVEEITVCTTDDPPICHLEYETSAAGGCTGSWAVWLAIATRKDMGDVTPQTGTILDILNGDIPISPLQEAPSSIIGIMSGFIPEPIKVVKLPVEDLSESAKALLAGKEERLVKKVNSPQPSNMYRYWAWSATVLFLLSLIIIQRKTGTTKSNHE